ncbi:MAG: AMP-binding protein [Chloroflexi bacterium]|nr:AMP-binding protein [Chloroflexota bacterium]
MASPYFDADGETAPREILEQRQLTRARRVIEAALAHGAFYQQKLRSAGVVSASDVSSLDDLRRLPFTTKAELIADQAAHPPFGSRLTEPVEHYVRLHQTSGTTGRPLRIVDTDESWDWWLRCWGYIYRGAAVGPGDRLFAAFSFGPFIGFWSGFEGARLVGAMRIPGGGQTTEQRIQQIFDLGATVLMSTPTYALRMAETARSMGADLRASPIRKGIHAGEPGASIPSTRAQLEEAWGMEVFDHPGMTEVGPWGFECLEHAGVHLLESEYIFEVLDPTSGKPGDEGELIITNLGRGANPVIRYRTGDRVRLTREPCGCGRTFRRIPGGVIGRIDDMLIVRGVNVFPSAIENIVRRFDDVHEFTVELYREHEMDEMEICLETARGDGDGLARAIAIQVHVDLGFRPRVSVAPAGTLPRFELKARRVFDHRS